VIRLAIRVKREQAELVLAELLTLSPAGVEEQAVGAESVEFAVYGAPGELPSLPDLDAVVGDALVEVSAREIADDWQERWKQFHKPVLVASSEPRAVCSLHVRPPWEAAHGGEHVRELVIDPGQAFGTGAHATTRLCLELLLELAARPAARGPLLDIGTGSGVLAIAAALVGFAPVLGLDNDSESVRAAAANSQANAVMIETRRLDVRSEPLPWLHAPPRGAPLTATANLLRPLLLDLARALKGASALPAEMILGGLLAHEVDEVAEAYAAAGLREHERRQDGEWAALWLSSGRSAGVG
jgi:ribosomal protein L11 methyltransferase